MFLANSAWVTFRDGQSGTPLVSQDVQAYTAIRVDIWVVDPGGKVDFRWFKWVIGRKVYSKEEDTSGVRTITLLCRVISYVFFIKHSRL